MEYLVILFKLPLLPHDALQLRDRVGDRRVDVEQVARRQRGVLLQEPLVKRLREGHVHHAVVQHRLRDELPDENELVARLGPLTRLGVARHWRRIQARRAVHIFHAVLKLNIDKYRS